MAAITDLKFADRLIYTNNLSVDYQGMISFNDDLVNTVNIDDFVPFALHETGENYAVHTLFTYADGSSIRMHYRMYKDMSYYLKFYFDLVDENEVLIDIPGSVSHNNPSQEQTRNMTWEDEPGFDTFPWSECYYVPSWVDYFVQGTETLVGDSPGTVFVHGGIFWKKTVAPLGGYGDLGGQQSFDDLDKSYGRAALNIALINNQEGYTAYFGAVDPEGEYHKGGEIPPAPNPSGTGGGDRPRDDDGDPVDFPGLPSTSVISTGLITLYSPDATALRSLASVLWGNDFEQSIKKVLNDPFDGLIDLSMVPFTPTTQGSVNCEIGNFDTEVSMPVVSAQYYTIDCGTVQLKENWGNALDYNATSVEIFVPFVGFRALDNQDCMGRTLALKYNVDILTGAAIAILKCGNKCLYEWPCNMAYNIPLTGSNKAALYTGLISVAMSGLGGLARGGAMGAVGGAATSAINVATSSQSDVQRGGSLASNTGVLGEFLPYIVVHRPKQSMPSQFKNIKGYQSNITSMLGNCVGYTEVDYVHLTGISGATDTELQEIERLLKEGVII